MKILIRDPLWPSPWHYVFSDTHRQEAGIITLMGSWHLTLLIVVWAGGGAHSRLHYFLKFPKIFVPSQFLEIYFPVTYGWWHGCHMNFPVNMYIRTTSTSWYIIKKVFQTQCGMIHIFSVFLDIHSCVAIGQGHETLRSYWLARTQPTPLIRRRKLGRKRQARWPD